MKADIPAGGNCHPKMSDRTTQETEDGEGREPLYDPDYDYYSIDNILEEDVLLKVKTVVPIPHAKQFRECKEDGIIPANTELELPGWLVLPLIRDGTLELMEPKEFSSKFLWVVCFVVKDRSQIWAEPTAVNIRSKCPVFYSLGMKVAQLTHNPSLLLLLLRFFLDRSQLISKTAQSRYDQDNSSFLLQLTK